MDDLSTRFNEGLRLRSEGRMPEAAALFEALSRSYPRVGAPRSLLGLTRCSLGDFDRGLEDLREGIALDPRNADLHCNLGSVYFAMNRIDEAETTLRRALAIAPANADALNNLGLVLRTRGDFAGALAAARRAFALRPQMAQARFNMSLPLLALGRFAEAWEQYAFRPTRA
jgi:tetratricopeptide (TPR) repeat protein